MRTIFGSVVGLGVLGAIAFGLHTMQFHKREAQAAEIQRQVDEAYRLGKRHGKEEVLRQLFEKKQIALPELLPLLVEETGRVY